GDLDYCYNEQWQECSTYVSASGKANECGCMGAGITINKSDVWTCRVPPINFVLVDTDAACGTACDSDSDLTNTEVLDGNGQCILPDLSCSGILKESSWIGNTSLIEASVKTACPCNEDASCTFSVESNGLVATTLFSATYNTTTTKTLIPNFEYGNNNVTISCECSVVSVTCEDKTPATVKASSEIISGECVAGKVCDVVMNVSNIGSVDANLYAYLEAVIDTTLYTNSSQAYVSANNNQEFTFTSNQSCDWYKPTWETGQAGVPVIYQTIINVTDLPYKFTVNSTNSLVQCQTEADCTVCCSAGADCWLNSTESADFACSAGVCCLSEEHFQNGACCISSERCCVDDPNCNTGEWCDNSSVVFTDANFICKEKKDLGQSCEFSRECLSEYCGNGICADPEPVALSEWYECKPYLANSYCSYESVGGSYNFDPQGCNVDDECSSGYYCYMPRRACLECADANTVYGSLNISNDGLCPSISCVGSDLDCCTGDSDCASTKWCDASASCTSCSDRSDSVCSSSSCIDIDPDCCASDADCGEGLKCVSSTCTGNVGESCTDDGQCTGGLKCLGNVCAKESFTLLSPEEDTYQANLGETLKLTLVVNDPQNKQDTYTAYVDSSYVPDSAYVKIDGVSSESFEMGKGEVRKFLVTVAAAKIKDGSPDINTWIRVKSTTNALVSDSQEIKVDVNPITTGDIPAAPTGAWLAVLILGYAIGMVTRG
ncbi:MAG: hypothetical protein GOV01_03485, partial [Candidatus Altiarchaeota archaeon]|nr:hypothetical protein [Candidatus Altiarchaeota archaeon]